MNKWFAWHPVLINNKWFWLKTVYRSRRYMFNSPGGEYPVVPVTGYWVYSSKEDV